ncbi:hypothetical protein B0O99DRAFT_614321 [Bisporella sp. PMI_857]|nr:hypothetical protein B0O99DRAFT_614321 [Bisporella sp. PMI_857]
MASARVAVTPPPLSRRVPDTPLFGGDDFHEPYSPRRKSARVSQRSRVTETPPPQSPKNSVSMDRSSPPPSSPQTAPKKLPKNSSYMESSRRVSGALNYDSAASAAAVLGLPTPTKKAETNRRSELLRNNGMLPTPDKTPKKRPSEAAPAVKAVARTLFSSRSETIDEVMPSPKKKARKKYTGFTLDSFGAGDGDESIPIYTDSNDRIPEVDTTDENPFYGEATIPPSEPAKRTSKRRKIHIPGEGEQDLDEAEKRDDGLVYVFRGKKVFRKFGEDSNDVPVRSETARESGLEGSPDGGRVTRSAIKPRLLFPTAQQIEAKEKRRQAIEDEEEAVTDIEEHEIATPVNEREETVTTPKAPKFAPFSPPPTARRTTRSKDVQIGNSPAGPGNDCDGQSDEKKLSPFNNWPRTKRGESSKKRTGSPIRDGGRKKVRGA